MSKYAFIEDRQNSLFFVIKCRKKLSSRIFFLLIVLLFCQKSAKFLTNYQNMNFPIEADGFKFTFIFYKYAVISAKFAINYQNKGLFQGWYFLNAQFSCVIRYYFVQKLAKPVIWKGFKKWNSRKMEKTFLPINSILWRVRFSDIEFCEESVFLALNFVKSPFV